MTLSQQNLRLVIAIIIAHVIAVIVHAAAHFSLDVNLSILHNIFIVLVIMLSPVAAGILIWKGRHHAGVLLFGASMFGAFAFGFYFHLVENGIDNIANIPAGTSGDIFRLSAIALAIVEAIGSIVGWRLYTTRARRK